MQGLYITNRHIMDNSGIKKRPRNGDLRYKLVTAALNIVEKEGHEALTLRNLTAGLRVSQMAPYRHFRNREALLIAVTVEILNDIECRWRLIEHEVHTAQQKVRLVFAEVLNYAKTKPKNFQLIYEMSTSNVQARSPLLDDALRHAYQAHFQFIACAMPELSTHEIQTRVITIWATIIGFSQVGKLAMTQHHMRREADSNNLENLILDFCVLQCNYG